MSRICTYLAILLYSLYLLYVVRYLSYVKITQLLQSPRKKLLILNFTLPKDHCPFLILFLNTLLREICSLCTYLGGTWNEISDVCVTGTLRSPKFCCRLKYINCFGAKEQLEFGETFFKWNIFSWLHLWIFWVIFPALSTNFCITD